MSAPKALSLQRVREIQEGQWVGNDGGATQGFENGAPERRWQRELALSQKSSGLCPRLQGGDL